jgi:hypothetical protein
MMAAVCALLHRLARAPGVWFGARFESASFVDQMLEIHSGDPGKG